MSRFERRISQAFTAALGEKRPIPQHEPKSVRHCSPPPCGEEPEVGVPAPRFEGWRAFGDLVWGNSEPACRHPHPGPPRKGEGRPLWFEHRMSPAFTSAFEAGKPIVRARTQIRPAPLPSPLRGSRRWGCRRLAWEAEALLAIRSAETQDRRAGTPTLALPENRKSTTPDPRRDRRDASAPAKASRGLALEARLDPAPPAPNPAASRRPCQRASKGATLTGCRRGPGSPRDRTPRRRARPLGSTPHATRQDGHA